MKVFISYAVEDKIEAGQLHARLTLLGFNCFLSHRDMPKGAKWRAEIVHAIRAADVFIPILTQKALGSAWVLQETGMAHLLGETRKRLMILPLTVNCNEPPGCLSEYQSVRAESQYWGLSGKVKMEDGLVATLAAEVVRRSSAATDIKAAATATLTSASVQDTEYILQVLHTAGLEPGEFLDVVTACYHTFAVIHSDRGMGLLISFRNKYVAELTQNELACSMWNEVCKRYKARKDEEQKRHDEILLAIQESQKKALKELAPKKVPASSESQTSA